MRPGRAATDADAILGVRPKVVHAPESLEEATELMKLGAREGMRLSFVGGGTELELGAPPRALDAVLRTDRLTRLVEYAPDDMVITVEAGMTLAMVQASVQAHRQRLGIDSPQPDRATIGGIVAANSFGPRRARYGSVRDLIIGVSLVRADGAVARGGGKVVKNVAGFDLPKVMCGSLGTLGMIATATFRLHPLPESSVTWLVRNRSTAQLEALRLELKAAQLEPASFVGLLEQGGWNVAVRFEGFGAGVEQQGQRLASLAGKDRTECTALGDTDSRAFWAAHDAARIAGTLRIKVAALPGSLQDIEAQWKALLGHLRNPGAVWYAPSGIGFASGTPEDPPGAIRALESLRSALTGLGGSLVLLAAPPEVRTGVDVWGPKPASWRLMERLKQRFDPEHRLNPGRFVGGL